MESEPTLPPLLRWAGSKRQQIQRLRAMIPDEFGRYIEPFAGSACLYWALQPKRAVISDLNRDLIGCYRAVRDDPLRIHRSLSHLSNDSETFYRTRCRLQTEADPIRRAAYFIYLNRFCFNGLYRTDKQGNFNVPYGGARTGALPSLATLRKYSEVLSTTKLECADFEKVVCKHVRRGDVVYLDPPFYASSIRVFNAYTAQHFGPHDLERLDRTLTAIDNAGATFVASYLKTADIMPIARKWRNADVTVLRRMSGFTEGRRKTQEIVFSNISRTKRTAKNS